MSDNNRADRPAGRIYLTTATPDKTPLDTPALIDALRQADFDASGRLLGSSDADAGQLASLAEGLVRRRRWRDAEWLFSRIDPRSPSAEMKRMLSRNMAALQAHMDAVAHAIRQELGQSVEAVPSGCPKCGASEELVEDTSTFGQKSSRCMKCGHEWDR